jgi:flavin-dependent dehydrogenase
MVRAGLRVVVLDRARFPRVKLCAGWISAPIWDALELAAADYPRGLWRWERCHVRYHGVERSVPVGGWFIRRLEFDEFLLRRSGAEVVEGHTVKSLVRDGDRWLIDGRYRARYLVGAGGTQCPVARQVFAPKPRPPVGVQELELPADPAAVAAARRGDDGEPELFLHDDLRGYAWNVPKTDWLNLGCGTLSAREVRSAWRSARDYFVGAGHVPAALAPALERMEGWSYYLFHPAHLDDAQRDGACLVGDALGLAQPLTAEGILPSVISGALCGEAIAAGEPARYPATLRAHPVLRDYHLWWQLRDLKGALPTRSGAPRARGPVPGFLRAASSGAVATGFAWLFAGKRVPAPGPVRAAVSALHRRYRKETSP